MFKKKRNALLEEMRRIAESETVRVLESAGMISGSVHVLGQDGVRSSYVAKPAEDHAARALAEEALEAAGAARIERIVLEALAAQKLERETAKAYRAADEALVAVDAAAALVEVESAKNSLCVLGCSDCTHNVCLRGTGPRNGLHELSELDRIRRSCGIVPDLCSEFLHDDRALPACLSGLAEHCELFFVHAHCSSPVVAESEAATSDAPAMTVQEGGSSDAAPGVEGVSPASSTPRFVVLGDRVYDRDANKVAACVSPTAARSVADELNTGGGQIINFYWEVAK